MYCIANFYRFVRLDDPQAVKTAIEGRASAAGLVGTVLIGHEGINAGLAGPDSQAIANLIASLGNIHLGLANLEPKWSAGESLPYKWLEVKVKKAIVTFAGDQDPDVETIHSAARLTPAEFDQMMAERGHEVVVVDTRNNYEFQYGHFDGAVDLGIKKFKDFPEAFQARYGSEKDRTFVFFCTGGIRCEKAVPWANQKGFKNVFQIEGGIIKYLEHHKNAGGEENSRWRGSCFVFDQRWAIDGQLSETSHEPPGQSRTC
ncbi:MAG: hypothetical protein RIQ81_147 [Pseudomonadota bacterium]